MLVTCILGQVTQSSTLSAGWLVRELTCPRVVLIPAGGARSAPALMLFSALRQNFLQVSDNPIVVGRRSKRIVAMRVNTNTLAFTLHFMLQPIENLRN